MSAYIFRRLLANIPVLLFLSFSVFMLVRILPGDIVTQRVAESGNLNQADVEGIRTELGLNKPFYQAYPQWLGNVLRGDFGESLRSGGPVRERLLSSLPISLELAALAVVLACCIGLPAGILAAVFRNSPVDYVFRLSGIIGLSMPTFWTGTLAILLPAVWFDYLPPLSYVGITDNPLSNLQIMIIPGLVLGFSAGAIQSRLVRSMMLEVLREDYIRTARAKGLTQRMVVLNHAVKNAFIPIIEIVSREFGVLVGGTVIMESIFSLPGLGRLTLDSIQQRDYPQIQANALFFAMVLVSVNLFIDVMYAWLDPRIRYD